MLVAQASAKPVTISVTWLEEVPLPLKFTSDLFGLFAYLFVMGSLLPSDVAADPRAGRKQ